MKDFIQFPQPSIPITTVSKESAGTATGSTASSWIGGTWPAANRAIFITFNLFHTYYTQNAIVANGSNVINSQVDIGVYTADGRLIGHTGSVPQLGPNRVQVIPLVLTLAPGCYWMAMSLNSSGAWVVRKAMSISQFGRLVVMAQMASAHPLPEVATFSVPTATQLPLFGITSRSF